MPMMKNGILTPGVQDDGVQKVARRGDHAGQDTRKVGTAQSAYRFLHYSLTGNEDAALSSTEYSHPVADGDQVGSHKRDSEHDDPGQDPDGPEALPHGGPFLEEVRQLDFFDGGCPLHVVSRQVGEPV